MAMGNCRECDKPVSSEAKTCPNCGVKRPINVTSRSTKMIAGMFALLFVIYIAKSNDAEPTPAPLTPEQQAAKARKELAFQKTVLAARAIKKNLREPESVTWESIRANDDGDIICLEYRAKNGFGGMNREIVVITHGKVSQEASVWNKVCPQAQTDMKHVRQVL